MKIKINDRTVTVPRLFWNEVELNKLVKKHTAFASIHEMLNAGGTYRPSIYLGGKTKREQRELVFIAIEYNTAQRERGDARRVFKGDWRPVFRKEFPILDEVVLGECAVPGCESQATDIANISIDNQPKKNCAVCRCHYDAALEDVAPATAAAVRDVGSKWVQGD